MSLFKTSVTISQHNYLYDEPHEHIVTGTEFGATSVDSSGIVENNINMFWLFLNRCV